ncbi:MAG TPA: AAA family ATPase [Methanobacterium sp.]|nr:AAA family ATPase [Methanobacterium sp.]
MSSRDKQENALGKGLDALIRKDYLDEKPTKSSKKPSKTASNTGNDSKDVDALTEKEKIDDNDKTFHTQDSNDLMVDDAIINAVLREVHKNPRISLWSAKSAAVLRFLKKTKPEFSISNEASLLIEEAVKDRHPEIWKIFEEKGL